MKCGLCFLTCCLLLCAAASKDRRAELLSRQQATPNGVVHLTPPLFDEFACGKPRPYSLIIMLKADHLAEKTSLQLPKILEEFQLTSQAYRLKYESGPKAGKVFFATLEYEESGYIFERLGIKSLPLIIRIPGHMTIKKTGEILLGAEDKMTPQTYTQYPWSAEVIGDFVRAQTGISVERMPRYSIMDSVFFVPAAIGLLAALLFLGYNLLHSSYLQSPWIYIVISMAVCWFATSGGLFNIIRGVPFMSQQRDGNVQLFYPGASQQLGAEGFIMGSGYIVFSVVFLLSTHVVPRMQSAMARRLSFYMLATICCFCLKQIMTVYFAKTGYHFQQYIL